MLNNQDMITTTKKGGKADIIHKNIMGTEKVEKSGLKISELKKELIDIKKSELSLNEKETKEEIPEEEKQKCVEQIIKKWLNLQKTIKEEITLEDVIIKQQENDRENLKSFFRKYYDLKINKRRKMEDIKELKLETKDNREIKESKEKESKESKESKDNKESKESKEKKEKSAPSYTIEKDVESQLRETCEPIKNLLFILRNNYDYLTRLLSLIKPDDYTKNINNINSLVELLNNQFYENILIPNPEQQELLILIYKLIEEEIMPMAGVCPDDFLNNKSLLGIFLTSYARRQEITGYISMILNSTILSIDNDPKDCLDLSIPSIKKYLEKLEKEKETKKPQKLSKTFESKMDFDKPNFIRDFLAEKIEKTNIKFKNNFELEAEKEKEDDFKFFSKDDNTLNTDDYNYVLDKHRKSVIQRHKLFLNKDNMYNNEYKNDLNKKRLLEKINKENDSNLKQIFVKHLERLNNYPNKYTNEGIIRILDNEVDKRQAILETYKDNFIYVKELIEELLQIIVDKIITFPYPFRCICKIINILISKKFPYLSKYEVNTYVGKFFLDKCLFPVLSLENQNFIDSRVFSTKTKNCLDVIINVLSKANNCSLFDTYSDPEKTIFNQFLIEIIPILNKFYDKIIDVPLPKVLDDLINKTNKKMEQSFNKKIFNFRHKKEKKDATPVETPKGPDLTSMPPPLFQYFEENSDEILHIQSICFSIKDIKFMIDLIGRNMQLFSDLPKYNFFTKTYNRIKNEEQIYTNIINEENSSNKKKFFVIFKDEINAQLEKIIKQKKKDRSTFENNKQDSEIICKRIKFCIKTILKGLNLLNIKDFAYLNFAQSSDKFFSALKYTLEELGEYSGLSNNIPLKWYSQYIFNYKKELGNEYQKDDFLKLYEEIYTEESNILNELKSVSSTIITRNGMNLRCAEKIIEKIEYELRLIEEAKKNLQVEKFINTKKVEVCIMPADEVTNKGTDSEDLPIIINDLKSCQHSNSSNEKKDIIYHASYIEDFINKFSDKEAQSKIKLRSLFTEDIKKGDRANKSYAIIGKYLEYVKKQIKDPDNRAIFGDIKEKEAQEFLEKIQNHIIRQIYRYIYPTGKDSKDVVFYNLTRGLEWIQPEHLEIKKLYVNQLKFAENCMKKIDEAHSVSDKLECIHNAYVTMNNTVKFSSGKNEDAGQDELTPLFQYILIKSQPEHLVSNINYIKSLLSEEDLISPKGFFVSQMESASQFIQEMTHDQLRMTKAEFDRKIRESTLKYSISNDKGRSNIKKN